MIYPTFIGKLEFKRVYNEKAISLGLNESKWKSYGTLRKGLTFSSEILTVHLQRSMVKIKY